MTREILLYFATNLFANNVWIIGPFQLLNIKVNLLWAPSCLMTQLDLCPADRAADPVTTPYNSNNCIFLFMNHQIG